MKPSVGLLVTCSIVLVGRSVCQASQSTFPFPPSTDEKTRSIIERLVTKVDNLQQKFVDLRNQLQEHRQEVTKIRENHDKTLVGILITLHRLDERLGNDFGSFSVSFGLLQNRTLEILSQQTECANHELFREKVFKYLPQQNERTFQKQPSATAQSRLKNKPPSQQSEDSVTSSTRLPEVPADKTTATPLLEEGTTVRTPIAQVNGTGTIPLEHDSEKPPIQQIEISVTSASRLSEDNSETTASQQECGIPTTDRIPTEEVNGIGSIPAEQNSEEPPSQQIETQTQSVPIDSVTSSSQLLEDPSGTTTLQQENIIIPELIHEYEGSGWDVSIANCKDEPSKISGPYLIRCIKECLLFTGYCEQQAFGGGWLVVQHRFDGSLDFQRSWTEYRDGFGDINKEFWIGLEKLHQLTSTQPSELVVEIKDFQGRYAYARYDAFEIGDEGEQYGLKTLRQCNGTAGDSMAYHRGMKFSTLDRDNDESDENCAQKYGGAWWYKGCYDAHLNGRYMNARKAIAMGWYRFKNSNQGLSYSRMIRPLE